MTTIKNANLGKYDLNKLLRNPGLIHKIQDALCSLKGKDMLSIIIRGAAVKDIDGAIKLVREGYNDNPQMMLSIVGKEVIEWIEEFTGADDIPDNLFQSPKIF